MSATGNLVEALKRICSSTAADIDLLAVKELCDGIRLSVRVFTKEFNSSFTDNGGFQPHTRWLLGKGLNPYWGVAIVEAGGSSGSTSPDTEAKVGDQLADIAKGVKDNIIKFFVPTPSVQPPNEDVATTTKESEVKAAMVKIMEVLELEAASRYALRAYSEPRQENKKQIDGSGRNKVDVKQIMSNVANAGWCQPATNLKPAEWEFNNLPESTDGGKKFPYLSAWDDPAVNPFMKVGILDRDGQFAFARHVEEKTIENDDTMKAISAMRGLALSCKMNKISGVLDEKSLIEEMDKRGAEYEKHYENLKKDAQPVLAKLLEAPVKAWRESVAGKNMKEYERAAAKYDARLTEIQQNGIGAWRQAILTDDVINISLPAPTLQELLDPENVLKECSQALSKYRKGATEALANDVIRRCEEENTRADNIMKMDSSNTVKLRYADFKKTLDQAAAAKKKAEEEAAAKKKAEEEAAAKKKAEEEAAAKKKAEEEAAAAIYAKKRAEAAAASAIEAKNKAEEEAKNKAEEEAKKKGDGAKGGADTAANTVAGATAGSVVQAIEMMFGGKSDVNDLRVGSEVTKGWKKRLFFAKWLSTVGKLTPDQQEWLEKIYYIYTNVAPANDPIRAGASHINYLKKEYELFSKLWDENKSKFNRGTINANSSTYKLGGLEYKWEA
jgi:hypothetical protein